MDNKKQKQDSGVKGVPGEAIDASLAVLQVVKLVATICGGIEDERSECSGARNDEGDIMNKCKRDAVRRGEEVSHKIARLFIRMPTYVVREFG